MSLNRRDFLEYLGLGAAASVVVHKAGELPTPAADPQEPAVAYRSALDRAFCCSASVEIEGSLSAYSLRNGNVSFTADGYPDLEGSL